MTKVTTTVLMLFLTLSGAFCYANDMARTKNKKGDGIPIEVKECTGSLSQLDMWSMAGPLLWISQRKNNRFSGMLK